MEKGEKKLKFEITPENVPYFLEEIKSMRDEINWRVKMAYTGSFIFISAIVLPLGTFFDDSNKLLQQLREDNNTFTLVGIILLLAIAAWSGVQNANHIIEKRIELYTLDLMYAVTHATEHPHASWLGFLYGNSFFKSNTKTFLAKMFNASIGFFIYFLPNIVSLVGLFALYRYGNWREYLGGMIFASFFVMITVGSTIMFFFYVSKVNKEFTQFYNDEMKEYFGKFRPELVRQRDVVGNDPISAESGNPA